MRGLLFGSASVFFAFGTIVLAQSPNAPQIQSKSPGLLAPGVQPAVQLPTKPLTPGAVGVEYNVQPGMQLPTRPLLPGATVPGGVPRSIQVGPNCATCPTTPKHLVGASAAVATSPRPAFKPSANEASARTLQTKSNSGGNSGSEKGKNRRESDYSTTHNFEVDIDGVKTGGFRN
jgi:hypothetical protein